MIYPLTNSNTIFMGSCYPMINAFEAMKRSEEIPVRPEKKKIVFQALSSQICLLDGWKKVKHVSQNGDSPLSHETEHEIKR